MIQIGRIPTLVQRACLALLLVQVVFSFTGSTGFPNRQGSPAAAAASEAQPSAYLPLINSGWQPLNIFGVGMDRIAGNYGLIPFTNAGTQWVRRGEFAWSAVEPQKGLRNWNVMAGLESEMVSADTRGLQMILIIQHTPAWAQELPNSACGPIKESEIPAFASFVHDLVVRYSVPPYNVKYWEIWNEPDAGQNVSNNFYGCWGVPGDPYYGGRYYARVLQAVYPAVKSADVASQVLVGGLVLDCDPDNPPEWPVGSGQPKDCTSARYLEGILRAGGGPYFDGISYHSYDYYVGPGMYANSNWHSAWNTTGPVLRAKSDFLKRTLVAFGYPNKYLMDTEIALLCEQNCDAIFETTKAHFLTQAYAVASAEGLRANIWFDSMGLWLNSGLLYADLSPRPAFNAFQASRERLYGTLLRREIGEFPGVMGFEFIRPTGRVWIVWSLDGLPHTLSLLAAPLGAWDSLGTPLTAEASLQVNSPVYLEWGR